MLGLTFKENCSDLRNSKVAGLVQELEDYRAPRKAQVSSLPRRREPNKIKALDSRIRRNDGFFEVSYGIKVYVHDPLASAEEARDEHGITLREWESLPAVDAIELAVAHADYLAMPYDNLIGFLGNREL